jgi:DME family drug/metabolite transporter
MKRREDVVNVRSGTIFVVLAAALWATLGLFYRHLIGDYGLAPLTIAFYRAAVGCACLLAGLLALRPALLRVRAGDLAFFAAMGLGPIALFYVVYIYAIDLAGVATAAVLLYTAPAIVTVASWRLYGESLTPRKMAALSVTFAGCLLVARAYDPALVRLNLPGILFGLASGLTYALYSILGKRAIQRYSMWTVMVYSLAFGTLFLLPLQSPAAIASAIANPESAALLLLLGLGPTLAAFGLYTAALTRLPAGTASIIATLEPFMATALAFFFLGETLAVPQMLGGALILGAVMLLGEA